MREKSAFEEAKRKKEEAALLKPVQVQKVPLGVDPKTVLCAFFKAGQCEKGAKCKFSHDLNVGRKVEKRNIYEDSREDKATGVYSVCIIRLSINKFCTSDTMDKWDEEKLRDVVLSKGGNPRTTTDVCLHRFPPPAVSDHGIRSCANSSFKPSRQRSESVDVVFHHRFPTPYLHRYGWFWECPNGENCMYRHALPPGFKLKAQRKAEQDAEKANIISLEEFIEVEVCVRIIPVVYAPDQGNRDTN